MFNKKTTEELKQQAEQARVAYEKQLAEEKRIANEAKQAQLRKERKEAWQKEQIRKFALDKPTAVRLVAMIQYIIANPTLSYEKPVKGQAKPVWSKYTPEQLLKLFHLENILDEDLLGDEK